MSETDNRGVVSLDTLDLRIRFLEEDRARFTSAVESIIRISANMEAYQRDLLRGVEKMSQHDKAIKEVKDDVDTLKIAQPLLESTSAVVTKAAYGIAALVILTIIKMFFIGHLPIVTGTI